MKGFLLAVLVLIGSAKAGWEYLNSATFQIYADRSRAPWTCKADFLMAQYFTVLSRYADAGARLQRVAARCPGTEIAERSALEYAQSLENDGKRADAIAAYENFVTQYPGTQRARLAEKSANLLKTS